MTEELQLADLMPDVSGTAARIAYLQLLQFQELSALVTDAPTLHAKQELGRVASLTLQRHEQALEVLSNDGRNGAVKMRRYASELDAFAEHVGGRDWDERVVTSHLAGGILKDFYALVVEALGTEGERLAPLIVDEDVQAVLHEIISTRIRETPSLGDRLAMWGRRITGDSLLAVRGALGVPPGTAADEVREGAEEVVDAISARLMAEHSRRMNALGLAA